MYCARFRIGMFAGYREYVFDCPAWVTTQQLAELYGAGVLIRLASRQPYNQVTMLEDNMQAVWGSLNLRAGSCYWNHARVPCGMAHQLRQSGLILHVVYTPTDIQPPDPLSRVQNKSPIVYRRRPLVPEECLIGCEASLFACITRA